ncbi:MAG: hypothetical protein IKY52_11760 [Clostridia bacterium]|nr:hypothetical protein [Clostridia bacterium]
MYANEKPNGPARVILLMLAFVCAAVTAFSLGDMLPAARYILTPADGTADSFLSRFLPETGLSAGRTAVLLTGTAAEMGIWYLGGLGVWAGAVFVLAALSRGACFGFVLFLMAGEGASVLAGGHLSVLAGWLAVTALMFCCGSMQTVPVKGKQFLQWTLRFLAYAGAAFWITLLCERFRDIV